MIRKLTPTCSENAFSVFLKTVEHMRSTGLDQWDELYPEKNTIEHDIVSGCAYGYFAGDIPVGYIAINTDTDPGYAGADWSLDDDCYLTVHRLAVDPGYRGRGIAKRLMLFAERHTLEKGFAAVRLDAFSKNPAAISLYDGLGYKKTGTVEFRKGTFIVFEKILKEAGYCG